MADTQSPLSGKPSTCRRARFYKKLVFIPDIRFDLRISRTSKFGVHWKDNEVEKRCQAQEIKTSPYGLVFWINDYFLFNLVYAEKKIMNAHHHPKNASTAPTTSATSVVALLDIAVPIEMKTMVSSK